LNIYIAPLRDSEALPTQVSAITSQQDNRQTFPKKMKEEGQGTQEAVVEEDRSS